jgi:hypothetical protein
MGMCRRGSVIQRLWLDNLFDRFGFNSEFTDALVDYHRGCASSARHVEDT